MKPSLFLKFLLLLLVTSFSVVILMVITMQFFVYRNFSDYVMQQELDSLDGLSQSLSKEYLEGEGWEAFRKAPRRWHATVNRYFPAGESRLPPPPEIDFYKPPPDYQHRMNANDNRRPRPYHPPGRDDLTKGDDRNAGADREWRPRHLPPRRAPELSEMSRRLSLFDADQRIIIGNPVLSEQVLRPIEIDSQVIGWLGLIKEAQMMNPTDISFLKRQSLAFYMIGAIVLIMAIVISILFSRHLTAPVRKIAEGANAIRSRRFDQRIPVTSNDELGRLAEDFNAMAQTLQSHESIRRQWLTDIAHELRTPLAVLRGEIEALQDGIRKINAKTIGSLHGEVMALSKIVDDLSVIAKTESGIIEMDRNPVNPVKVLEGVLRRFKVRFNDRQINVQADLQKSDGLMISGDADKLAQVFANIFENTLRYAACPGTLTVGSSAAKGHLTIFFEDTGPGVAEESLHRLFDRLYRTDTARTREKGGSGLGLSICKTIIEAHQGKIRAENSASNGLRIVIDLLLYRK